MCWFADTAVCRLAEVSGNEDTLAVTLSTGRSVLVSAASASAWLLPPLSFIIGIDQSSGQCQENGLFLAQLCRRRCWSSGEGFSGAREIGKVLECDHIWELQLEAISEEMRFWMAQNINSRGVTFVLAERRLLIEVGEQLEKKLRIWGNCFVLKNPVISWGTLLLLRVAQPQNTWWICPRRSQAKCYLSWGWRGHSQGWYIKSDVYCWSPKKWSKM